jgi:acyl-CoA thioesterase
MITMADGVVTPPADLGREFARRDGFMRHLGIKLHDVGSGTSELHMVVQSCHINFNGTCHGGALYALADSAFGFASNSHGILAAGIDTHMTYHVGVSEGEVLVATAHEISRSRRIAVYQVEILNSAGTLVAGFTGTVYITTKPNNN